MLIWYFTNICAWKLTILRVDFFYFKKGKITHYYNLKKIIKEKKIHFIVNQYNLFYEYF